MGKPRRKARARRRVVGGGLMSGALRQLQSSIVVSKTFRFIADAAVDTDINKYHIRWLLISSYHTALPSNGAYRLIDSFRIKSLRVEAQGAAGAAPLTVSADWYSAANGKSSQEAATSLGVIPARLTTSPPFMSNASFWQLGTDQALFRLVCPQYSVVDLALDIVLVDSTGEFVSTISTVTDALVYCKYLDSTIGSSAGHLAPQGYKNVINS